MSSILIATVPIHGHVTPLLAVASHFAARGDRVRFITGARFADAVSAAGAEHIPLPPDVDFDDRLDMNELLPGRAELRGSKAVAHDLEHLFVRPGAGHRASVLAEHRREPADVLLTDPSFAGSAFLIADPVGERPPIVMCGVLPLPLASRDTAPFGMGLAPIAGPVGRLRNAAVTALANALVFRRVRRIADEMHRELHGVPFPFDPLDWMRQAEAIGQFTVPEFEYPRSDAPAGLHFVGPVSASGSPAELPDWWDELDGSRPVVHVTQGTIANKDFEQLVGPTLRGLADEDVTVVVATGGRPLEELPPLPANARAAQFLPYDALLPKTSVVVTNGGYGGVQYALRYGVPLVVSGGKEDKPEVGARIAWSGVGRRFTEESPSSRELRRAVRSVLDDNRYRRAAGRIAASMARFDGAVRLAELVDEVAARHSSGPRVSR